MNHARLWPLLLFGLAATARAQSVTTLHEGGAPADRLDLVLVAEGYPAGTEAAFLEHARRLLAAMRGKEPFDRYLGLLNVHTVFEPSPGAGIGRPDDPGATRYGTRFPNGGGRMISGDLAAIQQAALAAPDVDRVLVLCNDDRHGGSAYGPAALLTTAFATTGASFEDVALHELGHIVGNLADEYADGLGELSPADDALSASALATLYGPYPNVTPWTAREQLPWRAWVEPDTRVPAGFFTRGVSAYEGAVYRRQGMYRPRKHCAMRENSGPFCEPCREALVLELARAARGGTTVDAASDGAVRVRTALPAEHLRVTHAPEGAGWRVTVEDGTPWVRTTREPLVVTVLVDVAPGAVTVESSGAGPAPAPPAPAPWSDGLVGALPGGSP